MTVARARAHNKEYDAAAPMAAKHWTVQYEYDCKNAHQVIGRFRTRREARAFSLSNPRTYVSHADKSYSVMSAPWK